MANFSEISSRYEKDSLVQKSAAEILFDMLDIRRGDSVLDIGCGTGHIARKIKEISGGRVVGVDPSEGMIEKAKESHSGLDISFRICSAEQLDYKNEFDVIFCNSAFQWFRDHKKALQACRDALRHKGRMAIQAPARDNYCPNFLKAIENVGTHESTRETFESFSPPWFFRETAEEYSALFEDAGLRAEKSVIDRVVTSHPPDDAYKIFESGAAAGYLNQDYYAVPLSKEYIRSFRDIVRKSFEDQAAETGNVDLVFYRIYLLAVKED